MFDHHWGDLNNQFLGMSHGYFDYFHSFYNRICAVEKQRLMFFEPVDYQFQGDETHIKYRVADVNNNLKDKFIYSIINSQGELLEVLNEEKVQTWNRVIRIVKYKLKKGTSISETLEVIKDKELKERVVRALNKPKFDREQAEKNLEAQRVAYEKKMEMQT